MVGLEAMFWKVKRWSDLGGDRRRLQLWGSHKSEHESYGRALWLYTIGRPAPATSKSPEVLKGIQVLIPFLGLDGTATAAGLISCHNTRLRTRIHEEGENFMSLYTRQPEISLTNNDKAALVLATAYANSVDLFKDNTRAIAIAKAYMSAYMKYADEQIRRRGGSL